MSHERACRICRIVAVGGQLPVREHGTRHREWHLCGRCWAALEIGLHAMRPGHHVESFVDPEGTLLSSHEVLSLVRDGLRRVVEEDGPPAIGAWGARVLRRVTRQLERRSPQQRAG